ncbi:MAG: DNA methyltransferase [Candidatus Hodarchaeota archaeon]
MTKEMEHIDYPIIAKTHTPMYSMHKYWTRKPHNVVSKYIEKYSNEGEIIFDPFCGSGVTVMEALKLGRKAIGVDLDPISTFITKCSLIAVDLEKLDKAYINIVERVKKVYMYLYETRCLKCRKKAKLLGTAWKDDKPFQKIFKCNEHGRIRSKLTQTDLKNLKESKEIEIEHWYPKNVKLPPMKKEKLDFVYELFSNRNLVITSAIYNEIESIGDENVKKIMKFIFTSALAQFTNMMPYVHESLGKICKGWVTHSYWVPPEHWELNVFEYFKLRYKEIRRGKEETNNYFSELKPAKSFKDLENGADYYIKNHSSLELINDKFPRKTIVPERSVDYIFTDPPYGGSIQFFELSVLWASWLKYDIDFEGEIIINRYQKKDFTRYDRMLRQAFKQTYRTLKKNRYMTVTFHNTSIRIRNSLIRAVVFGGFDMEKIVYQPPAVVSVKAQRQPYGSAIGDYYIRFKKTSKERTKYKKDIDEMRYDKVIIETVKRILAERREPTSYSYLLNFVDVELERNGLLLGAKVEIKDVLKKYLDKELILVNIQEGLMKGTKWWLKNPSEISFLERVPLNERLEKAILDVLKSSDKVLFDDIIQYIFMKFPNSLTPESQSVMSILEHYAIKTKDKRWRLNPDFKREEKMHQIIINYIAEIGVKSGYKIWCAHKDDETLKFSLTELSLPLERLDRIKEIDVLWIKDEKIECEFEVENTTQITDAVVRGSNISYSIKRFIVIPLKRENMLYNKFEEPLLREMIRRDRWKVIIYDELIEFYEANKKKKSINAQDFLNLGRTPIKKTIRQKGILEY